MPRLATMTADECWRLLGTDGVGRVGFDRGRGPRIHPINYTVTGRVLHVRTTEDSEFGAFVEMFGDGSLVSFEIDQLEGTGAERWSVLIVARVSRLDEDQQHALLPGALPTPAPAGPRPVVVRLLPVEVSGRRLEEHGTGGHDRRRPATGRRHHAEAGGHGSRAIPSYWHG